jgi:hypothetical protein
MRRCFGKNIKDQNNVILGLALDNYIYKKENGKFYLFIYFLFFFNFYNKGKSCIYVFNNKLKRCPFRVNFFYN